ncbi:MAG TPA: hypothetical protein VM911_11860, partial [Pyrinomonadaceae bacterium]|nr:hypothetical protein [Pyrinomonadaceae bacterium]
ASARQTPEQVRAALTKQGGERSIADRLSNRKALDLIVENALVSEEEWREEEPVEETTPLESTEAVAEADSEKTQADQSSEEVEAKAQSSSSDKS